MDYERGLDPDDLIYGDVVRVPSDEEIDRLIAERKQREADICDPQKINAAIEAIRDEWEAA